MYRALGTKSIVMKINSQGGVQANIGLWVETRTWQRFQAIPGRFRHPEDAPRVPCTRDQVDSIENKQSRWGPGKHWSLRRDKYMTVMGSRLCRNCFIPIYWYSKLILLDEINYNISLENTIFKFQTLLLRYYISVHIFLK